MITTFHAASFALIEFYNKSKDTAEKIKTLEASLETSKARISTLIESNERQMLELSELKKKLEAEAASTSQINQMAMEP